MKMITSNKVTLNSVSFEAGVRLAARSKQLSSLEAEIGAEMQARC